MAEVKIPVFSVLKKGVTLKNIFLNSPPPETRNFSSQSDAEDTILIGRHPDCHIVVDHPSISRLHLEVRSKPTLQKLFVTDRSSVHGTWVSGEKILPNVPIELVEGDTVKLGASTRIYRLHWMPLSHAFHMDSPLSPLLEEASGLIENDELLHQDEELDGALAAQISPSAPPMPEIMKAPSSFEGTEREEGRWITNEMAEENSCFSSIVPLLESVSTSWPLEGTGGIPLSPLANERLHDREESTPVRTDKKAEPSSLLSRRNKSIPFLQIGKPSKGNEDEVREYTAGAVWVDHQGRDTSHLVPFGEIDVKVEERPGFADKENMTPVNSKVMKSRRELQRSPLSAFKVFSLEEHADSNKKNQTPEAPKALGSCVLIEREELNVSDSEKLEWQSNKLDRSPLGEKKDLNAFGAFISDNGNCTSEVLKSLKVGKNFSRELAEFEGKEEEEFLSDKENLTPQLSGSLKLKKLLYQNHGESGGKESIKRKEERAPFQTLFKSSPLRNSSSPSHIESSNEKCSNIHIPRMDELHQMTAREKTKWYIVVDVGCFLHDESRKSLQLLEGIKGTNLIIPNIVIRELDHLKRREGLLHRGTKASSVLQWIENCMVNCCWWIHVQSSAETLPVASTPPASTPRSQISDFLMEIVSPTIEDHILDCALCFKQMKDDGKIVLLSYSTTLRIKAMAEGFMCETPKEFRESLVNPYSKRFMWSESSPRGSTWSCSEEVSFLSENYYYQQFPVARNTLKAAGNVKGLKLLLLHNSQNAHINLVL
ncbi:nuclear inhibitor of protein phosphatase 1 [Apostasia shenzhenica]|uniref:Nuclear inhibitor of protein phosphatase 1 n=1 Tax=Apostasia shenzhenica TaxID=1088818 RepID=A0A2I0AMR3_9ASPA|nr:nuclear inhibitor of protein phosphatase 1 [Apostasia shenzhenica]